MTNLCGPRSLQARCTVGLQRMQACGGSNAHIKLFDESRVHDQPCYSADNPYIPSTSEVFLLWEGCGTVTLGEIVRRQTKEFGDIEEHQRKIQLIGDGVEVETAIWAYIQIGNDLIGGKINQITRDSPPFINLVVDTAKPVPFPPDAVGVGAWPRGVQI